MASLGGSVLTLADAAKRQDPSGKTSAIVEVLSQDNSIVADSLWLEGNLVTGHKTTVRTGLPTVYWRNLNEPVPTSKSTTAQVTEACGMMEAWSECDVALAKLGGDVNAFRFSEARPFMEAMRQEFASTFFYGNSSTAPEEFNGLATRYSSLSAANGQNIVSGGGAGSDNSSIWFIVWSGETVHGIYPKGSMAGLQHEDLGIETKESSSGLMRVYRDQFQWHCGAVVKDWRYAVRIANIDISNLTGESSAADIIKLMIKAYHRIPNFNAGRAAIYMNRTVHQMLDIQMRSDVQVGGGLTYENVDGKPVMRFRGIPIRREDALTETESTVS